MIEWYQVFWLAIIQGFTEFLPISSSGHLQLPHLLLAWPDQGLVFDVAVHVGSLLAVLVYLRREVGALVVGFGQSLGGKQTAQGTLAWIIALATVPAGLAGLLLDDWVEANLRSLFVIGMATIGFGLLLGVADQRRPAVHGVSKDINWQMGLMIGLAQVLALIPGTSRSGITMTAGLMLGLDRERAARFSFLLSIPLIAAAGVFKAVQLFTTPGPVEWAMIGVGALVSAITAYCCIHWFLKLLARIGFMPFVIYRVVLGLFLLTAPWLLASA